jgi:hypothetical protein
MSNKEFRRHIAQILAQQRNEDQQPVVKKPPKSQSLRPTAVTEKKPPVAEPGKLEVRRKAK